MSYSSSSRAPRIVIPFAVAAVVISFATTAARAQWTHEAQHTNAPQAETATTPDRHSAPKSSSERPSASSITHAVEEELDHDTLVSLDSVNVTTKDGVVTLSGDVASLLAKERAAQIAETVHGVQFVTNRLTLTPVRRMDADDLESTILQALISNPATEGFNVTVEADPQGRVALTGQAQSRAEKELIGNVAKGVTGVTHVDNNVGVNYESVRTDANIAADIKGMLKWNAAIGEDHNIEVSVRDGVVTLSGTVPSAAEKRLASAIARTAGSSSVHTDALRVTNDADDRLESGQPARVSD